MALTRIVRPWLGGVSGEWTDYAEPFRTGLEVMLNRFIQIDYCTRCCKPIEDRAQWRYEHAREYAFGYAEKGLDEGTIIEDDPPSAAMSLVEIEALVDMALVLLEPAPDGSRTIDAQEMRAVWNFLISIRGRLANVFLENRIPSAQRVAWPES